MMLFFAFWQVLMQSITINPFTNKNTDREDFAENIFQYIIWPASHLLPNVSNSI